MAASRMATPAKTGSSVAVKRDAAVDERMRSFIVIASKTGTSLFDLPDLLAHRRREITIACATLAAALFTLEKTFRYGRMSSPMNR